jgi:hypothetical protein
MNYTDAQAPPDPTAPKATDSPGPFLADADIDGPGDAPVARLVNGLVFCPHCQGWVEPDLAYSGQIVACPHCDHHFRMPERLVPSFAPAASHQPAPGLPPGEPWFYGFIDAYAKIWMWFALLVFALVVLGAGAAALKLATGFGGVYSIAAPLAFGAIVVIAVPGLIGVLLAVAFMRLVVDAARNLRAIRQCASERGR